MRAGAGGEPLGCELDPDHAIGLKIDADSIRRLRHVDRRSGMQHAANRTASFMGAVAGLVALPARRRIIAATDYIAGKRVGDGDTHRPACADRC